MCQMLFSCPLSKKAAVSEPLQALIDNGADDNVSAMQTPVLPPAPNFLGDQVLADV